VRTKLKNVLSGKVVDKTFNAGTKVETATVDKRDMQYLYKDGTDFVFMDSNTYDQLTSRGHRRRRGELPAREPGGDRRRARGARRSTSSCPTSVVLEITYTEPGLQGDRSTGGTKPATVETGYEIAVPLVLGDWHQGQGRHPHRRLPRPCERLTWVARSKARAAGPGRALRGRPARVEP
jgi:elongation factor P